MSGLPFTSHEDERPPAPGWSMSKRFAIAAVAIVLLSGGATATVALNRITGIAEEVFPRLSQINAPKGVVTAEYNGGPQTFLILGSDRRVGAKDSYDRENPPHSDTILLVRFDPEQGQTSVLSIPRDLMVNIETRNGQSYPQEKINAAYTIGNKLGATQGGMVLAAETIEREVFPGLELNGIVDVSFKGFIKVVDTLGCAYVNVDHHYYNQNLGSTETNYTSIDIQPGYQKLCYENALDYVRYRHTDSDFVRVARQQDFLRDLREQISPGNELGQIDTVAKAVGHAIATTFHASAGELIELAKLIAFSQGKPLRQVKFKTSNDAFAGPHGGSYVTSTPELEHQTLEEFLHGHEKLHLPASPRAPHAHHSSHRSSHSASSRSLGLYHTSSAGENEAVKASVNVPFPVLYPSLQTGAAQQQQVRAYALRDQQNNLRHAYVVVWQQSPIGGYYDFEGTNWPNPPLFAHASTHVIDGREYWFVDDGAHIHVIGWRTHDIVYWLTNTLLEELSNRQMLALAKSAEPLH
ncbi:MAG TPA: LCP family protein [Solirubrobacteraceae bacterium]|nr:LCP family protein [Solirubrobacteraceae bacterium]